MTWWSRAIELCSSSSSSSSSSCVMERVWSLGIGAAAHAAADADCVKNSSSSSSSSSSICDSIALLLSQHSFMHMMSDRPSAAIRYGVSAAAVSADSAGSLHGCIHALKASASLGRHLLPNVPPPLHMCCHHISRDSSRVTANSSIHWHTACTTPLAARALLLMHRVVETGAPLADPSALDPHSSLYISASAALQRASAVLFACSLMISGGSSFPPAELRHWCAAAAPDLSACGRRKKKRAGGAGSSSACATSILLHPSSRRPIAILSYRPPQPLLFKSAKIIFLSSDVGTGAAVRADVMMIRQCDVYADAHVQLMRCV